ncbi:MAG: hypothetical protein U0136_14110 [Bdellovibrionota bacterium]
MLSRSILLHSVEPNDALQKLAERFSVPKDSQYCWDGEGRAERFSSAQSSIGYGRAGGDFSLAVDVYLLETTEEELRTHFLELSRQSVTIALPDETSESPFDYLIYRDGNETRAEVVELDGKFTVWKEKVLSR